jgi:hypothetical protein
MTHDGVVRRESAAWQRFFYETSDMDGRVLALLRVGFSVLVLVHVAALFPDVRLLWTEYGVLPVEYLSAVAGGTVPTLLVPLSVWSPAPYVAFALLGVHATLLLVGYRTRLQALCVLVWLVSFQNRNPLVTNGQDALLRIVAVLLVLLPCGVSWSVDARARRAPMSHALSASALWPLRLLELQVSFVMLSAALWKALGEDWTSGVALHYVTRLQGFWGNWPVTAALTESPELLAAATYLTLGLELFLPVAIWIPALRRTALLLAIGFHLALAYAMNLFLFPWIMILAWCSFLRASDLEAMSRVFRLRRFHAVRLHLPSVQRIRP